MRWASLTTVLCLGLCGSIADAQAANRGAKADAVNRSATQPSSASVMPSKPDAAAQVKSAEQAVLEGLHATDAYKEAKAKTDSLEGKLKDARQHGTPQEKLNASHDFTLAKQNLKDMESSAISADPQARDANKLLAEVVAQRQKIINRLESGMAGRLASKLVMERGDMWHESEAGHGLVEVVQVVDAQNSLVYAPIPDGLSQRSLVWMHGFPHDKVDGQIVDTGKTVFRISGRKQYDTRLGARTVYEMDAVDISK